ncbi:hypothetical protein AAMO2058_001588800 [Amorphochlora amoebiformis]
MWNFCQNFIPSTDYLAHIIIMRHTVQPAADSGLVNLQIEKRRRFMSLRRLSGISNKSPGLKGSLKKEVRHVSAVWTGGRSWNAIVVYLKKACTWEFTNKQLGRTPTRKTQTNVQYMKVMVRPTVLSSREVTTRTASPVNLHHFHQMRNVPLPGTADYLPRRSHLKCCTECMACPKPCGRKSMSPNALLDSSVMGIASQVVSKFDADEQVLQELRVVSDRLWR